MHCLQWGANGSCYVVNGKNRHEAIFNALVAAGSDSTGFKVSGSCDDIFVDCVQIELRGERSIAIDHTASSISPINYNIKLTELFDVDQAFMIHNPPPGSAQTIISCPTVQTDISSTTTGSMIFKCLSGILVVTSEVLSAEVVADVSDGAILTLSAQVVAGNTLVRDTGIGIYRGMTLITGDMETQGTGSLQVDATNIVGNVTNAGSMTIHATSLTGDIVNNGVMIVDIGDHQGTITNNGVINGIINGVRYGNWVVDIADIPNLQPELDAKANRDGDSLTNATVNGVNLSTVAFSGFYLNGLGNYVQPNSGEVINLSTVSGLYVTNALDTLAALMPYDELVLNGSSFNDQNPAGLGAPLKIEYGAAQATGIVDLSAAGDFTAVEAGQYEFRFTFQYGRTGGGGVSWIYFRAVVNGTQTGNSILAKLDGSNDDVPAQFSVTVDLSAADVVTTEVLREFHRQ